MASYKFDPKKQSARIYWRFGGRQMTRVFGCATEREAQRACARVEETLQEVEFGRLAIPPDADPKLFLFSGGKSTGMVEIPSTVTVAAMLELYRGDLPPHHEPSTRKMIEIHFRRLGEHVAGKALRSFDQAAAQGYVSARTKQTFRGRPTQRKTIEMELQTLRQAWAWVASKHPGLGAPEWSMKDLRFPKSQPVRPFMTWSEIEREIARGKLSGREESDLWDCLWLDREQVRGLLDHFKSYPAPPFLHPMVAAAAFTGARRSEICRSRVGDWNLEDAKGQLRQKKRDKDYEFTFRAVPMHKDLGAILRDWFGAHPGGSFAFPQPDGEEVTWGIAAHHFRAALDGSRWSVVKGWHVLRHSFASNLAAAGVDQRHIDSWMGHSTEIRLRYQHLRPRDQSDAIAML